jgi:hypothetical protein
MEAGAMAVCCERSLASSDSGFSTGLLPVLLRSDELEVRDKFGGRVQYGPLGREVIVKYL